MKIIRVRLQPTAQQIKYILVVLGSLIVGIVLLYTHVLVDELRSQEQKTVNFYADSFRSIIKNSNTEDAAFNTFFIEKIPATISFPMIIASPQDEPNYPYISNSINIPLDTTNLNREQQRAYLKRYIQEMGETYSPLIIRDEASGTMVAKIYYTNSSLITQLRMLPYVEIFVVTIFILMGYIGFNYIKRTEQSNVWVGLAKEAAHQLGTPLSSLLAWIEILKMSADDPRQIEEVMDEMKHDVDRLNKIAHRFSKIGSKPEMQAENIGRLIERVSQYFEHRLPHLGKRVEIVRDLANDIILDVNAELFEWVIENLIKNGAEAMESNRGLISIKLQRLNDHIQILVHDNGKGMSPVVRRQAFRPGFSTKKRGWGLGLSLCKRIIEQYHGGKIFVKESGSGKGTTFAIELDCRRQAA